MPNGKMSTGRMEAFSYGVIAIIVTIMVLQLTHPAEPTLTSLLKQAPIFLSYALSFLVVAIMWVNHHHLIHAVREVNARLLWSNVNLLFWMSLTPFVTDFMGRNPHAPFPVSLYGLSLGMCGLAFWVLRIEIAHQHRHDPEMSEYHSRVQLKNLFSAFLYLSGAGLAHVSIYLSYFVYVLIPAIYFLRKGSWRRIRSKDLSGRRDPRSGRGASGEAENYFWYTVGRGPFSSASRSQIMSSRE